MNERVLAGIAGALALTLIGWVSSALTSHDERLIALQARDRETMARLASLESDMHRVIGYLVHGRLPVDAHPGDSRRANGALHR